MCLPKKNNVQQQQQQQQTSNGIGGPYNCCQTPLFGLSLRKSAHSTLESGAYQYEINHECRPAQKTAFFLNVT